MHPLPQSALSAYSIVWLFVMFDLPVLTKAQRKRAAAFRKNLLKDGFAMKQLSVYIRHCAGYESAQVHIDRVKNLIPPEGHVSILKVTDRQFGDIVNLLGKKAKPLPPPALQLELF